MTLPDKALFTIKEAGEHLALSRASVYRLIDEGMLTRVYPRPRCARITRKQQQVQEAAQQAAQKRGGFLARFGLGG